MSDLNTFYQEILNLLPDYYNKEPDSNNINLMLVMASELQTLDNNLQLIAAYRDVDEAQGETLNYIGENLNQLRGNLTDELYRVFIKSKVLRNQSSGSINEIIDIIMRVLDVQPEDITIVELHTETTPEPAAIRITDIPISGLNAVGMDLNTFGRMVESMLAAGIRLETVDVSGTFEFVDTLINDTSTGFSDTSMTDGGTFGDVFVPQNEYDFPI